MTSTNLSAFEAAIVDTCEKHQEAHWEDPDYRPCVSIDGKYFVKFKETRFLWPEIATHVYISEYAQSQPETPGMPRISKVIHHFTDQNMMYMVMEHITLTDTSPDPTKIAEALRWLSEVPAPPDHVFGPLGGGVIRHSFFKDYEAPLVFSSIEALERYIEKVRSCLYFLDPPLTSNLGQAGTYLSKLRRTPLERVSLSGERLMFTQPDMHPSNFGVDEHGNTVLMDFGEIAMLPESFVAFTLASYESQAASATARSIGLSRRSHLRSMAVIASVLWMIADPRLGLNEDGYPKASVRKR
ncbi:hypothetical protein IEO21_04873 [Rhodonia placenta]|uniref:Aminoglycoside phosphotransferase domain-containing protein n=1 Tax=Rhodonia placenta TaxID=104341 RepID=A0A8H7P326_9APHY|nr:hypothetical protein IEO21_04873 [Postia placenta]